MKHLNNPLAEVVVKAVMKPVGGYFRYSELDKVVFVNNYLLSTNLYPIVNSEQLSVISEALIEWFPDRKRHAIQYECERSAGEPRQPAS